MKGSGSEVKKHLQLNNLQSFDLLSAFIQNSAFKRYVNKGQSYAAHRTLQDKIKLSLTQPTKATYKSKQSPLKASWKNNNITA